MQPHLNSPTLPSSILQPFFISLFLRKAIPTIPIKNPFTYLCHTTNSGFVKGSVSEVVLRGWSDTILISPHFPEAWAGITVLTITNFLSLRFNISLFPYPSNTITRTYIPLQTNCLTATIISPSLASSHTIYALPLLLCLEILPSCHRTYRLVKL